MPGTDTKVIPEMEVLTIATATAHQGDFRPPRKKSALPRERRERIQLTPITAARYAQMTIKYFVAGAIFIREDTTKTLSLPFQWMI